MLLQNEEALPLPLHLWIYSGATATRHSFENIYIETLAGIYWNSSYTVEFSIYKGVIAISTAKMKWRYSGTTFNFYCHFYYN